MVKSNIKIHIYRINKGHFTFYSKIIFVLYTRKRIFRYYINDLYNFVIQYLCNKNEKGCSVFIYIHVRI